MSATTTTAAAFRGALMDLLTADGGLSGAMVTHEPVSDPPRQTVTMGDSVDWEGAYHAMSDGRKKRDGTYRFTVVFMVAKVQAQRENEATAVALLAALEDYLADSPTLNDTVPGVQWAKVSEWEMNTELDGDGFAAVTLEAEVEVKELLR